MTAASIELGTLTPPADVWCGLNVFIAAVDDEAQSFLVFAKHHGASQDLTTAASRTVSFTFAPRGLSETSKSLTAALELDAAAPFAVYDPSQAGADRALFDALLSNLTLKTIE